MPRTPPARLEPRKTPVQARSAVTVQAINEATIQVLLCDGAESLTTTRVADRAGVSVGTLYQYYPNKKSLLCAVLQSHMNNVADTVESACERARGKPTAEVLRDVVEAFVDAKMERSDISTALYRIATQVDGPAIVRRAFQRSLGALETALKTAPDAVSGHDKFVVHMLFGAMTGTTKSVLEAGASTAMIKQLRRHLVLLCQSYVAAAAQARSRC